MGAVYIATAEAWDAEMRAKIDLHKERRGAEWDTWEEPLNVAQRLSSARSVKPILMDCATLWLTNHMMAEHNLEAETTHLIRSLQDCAAPVVVVSNEVGQGIVPENAMARRFRGAQGRLNQQLASVADLAVLVAAGLPLVLKGTLPHVD